MGNNSQIVSMQLLTLAVADESRSPPAASIPSYATKSTNLTERPFLHRLKN